MLNRPLPAPARDIALLIGRVVLGVVLFAHGWQKLVINGIAGTYGQFEQLGIPLAIVSASFTSFVEFVGGVLLVVGAFTTVVIALDLVVMVGAAGFVNITHGVFAQDGGWELVGVIVAAELVLAAAGPGAFSVDHLISSLRARAESPRPVSRRVPGPSGTFAAATAFDGRAPQRTGVAAQFTRLSPMDTGPIAMGSLRARLTPPTAPLPTTAQQGALAKAISRPDSAAAHTERLTQVPPAQRTASVGDPAGTTTPRTAARPPAHQAPSGRSVDGLPVGSLPVTVLFGESLFSQALLSGYDPDAPDPVAPVDTWVPAEPREPAEVASLFEPLVPTLDTEPAFGPRRGFDAPRPFTTPASSPAPVVIQRTDGLPHRVLRAERVGQDAAPAPEGGFVDPATTGPGGFSLDRLVRDLAAGHRQ